MTTKQLLDNAIDYIFKLVEQEDWICTELVEIPEEEKICENTCDGLCKDCVKRYLNETRRIAIRKTMPLARTRVRVDLLEKRKERMQRYSR